MTGTPLGTFTIPGPDPGTFGGPREITVGLDKNLYVMDYTGERVVVLSPSGQQIREIPEVPAPAPNGGFNQPEGLAIDQTSGQVYVTDTFNHRIQRFSSTGAYQAKWGYRGRGTGDAMDYPRGIAVDRQDRTLWLNNTRSAQIKHYSPAGGFLGQFGTQGANPDQFYYSRGIHAGTDGRLYVPDSGNRRLQVLTKSGALVWSAPCGTPALTGNYVLFGCTSVDRDSAGNVYAAAPTEDVIYKFSSTGHADREVRHPRHRGRPVRRGVRRRDPRQPDVRLRDGQQPDQRAEHHRPVPRVVRQHRIRARHSSAARPRSRSTPAAACTSPTPETSGWRSSTSTSPDPRSIIRVGYTRGKSLSGRPRGQQTVWVRP